MKLIKLNLNQISILTKNQIELFLKSYKFIILISIITGLNLFFNIFGIFVTKSNTITSQYKMGYINIIIAVNSLLLIIQTIFITVSCFVTQIKNNIHATELRYGYQVKNIYGSRITFLFGFSIIYLLILLIISLSFFGIGQAHKVNQNYYFLFRLYISSFAWYAILMFLTIVITLILARFLSESVTSIIATVAAIFFILFPAIAGVFSSAINANGYLIRNTYVMLVSEDYRHKLYQELKSDDIFKAIYQEFKYIYDHKTLIRDNNLLAGPKFWELNEDEWKQIKNYHAFVETVTKVLNTDNQSTSWADFSETSGFGSSTKEPFYQLFNKLLNSKDMGKYHHFFRIMEKYTANFTILKFLNIIYESHIYDWELGKNIRDSFSNSDQYFFIKTLNTLLLRIVTPVDDLNKFSSYQGIINAKQVKKDKIANILNPLRHFNLMFHSIDYKNTFLANVYNQSQFFYTAVPNINFSLNGEFGDLESSFSLKQNVPVEAIYIFYLVLGSLLVWMSSLGFTKKIKR